MAHLKGNASRSKAFGKVLAWVGGALILLVIAGIWMLLVSRGINSLGQGVGTAVVDYPLCADTAAGAEASTTKVVEIAVHQKCKSGWIHLPYGFQGYLNPGRNVELEVLFLARPPVLCPRGKPCDFGDDPRNRDFQVRGDEGVLKIEPPPPKSSKPKPKTGDT